MHISPRFWSLACAALAASTAHANYIVDGLSFGHKEVISSDRATIPGWTVYGEGHDPQILSDRIILTPPYPGNKRGAAWATSPLDKDEFVADVEFRASGQDRSNGNLQIWLTQGGRPNEISSVYTADKFDGLVLSVDQYGGRGGKIRGFLNDGTVSFKDHHSVDSLAFGQCDYPYRNRGIPSHLKVTQTGEIFAVEVDGNRCFSTNKVSLPAGYKFGISASSAENPDSFEIFKFTVSTTDAAAREQQARRDPPPAQQQQQQPPLQPVQNQPPPAGAPPSVSQDQINDINNRLQGVNQRVDDIYRLLQDMKTRSEQTHVELMSLNKNGPIHEHVGTVEAKVGKIEGVVMAIQKDLEGKDYRDHLANLQSALKDTHSGLQDSLSDLVTTHAPKMWTFVFLVIIFQVVMFGGYLVYKRRRDSAPKKYL